MTTRTLKGKSHKKGSSLEHSILFLYEYESTRLYKKNKKKVFFCRIKWWKNQISPLKKGRSGSKDQNVLEMCPPGTTGALPRCSGNDWVFLIILYRLYRRCFRRWISSFSRVTLGYSERKGNRKYAIKKLTRQREQNTTKHFTYLR